LLRRVCETCRDFGEAQRQLETVPISRPTIFMLVGCKNGERCVIERTENGFSSRDADTSAANDWFRSTSQWEARVSAAVMLTRTYEEAAANSRLRRETLAGWPHSLVQAGFDWVTPPVLNPYTRIAVEMCPANGALRVAGYECEPGADLSRQVARLRERAMVDA
jgi:hypothetical protein